MNCTFSSINSFFSIEDKCIFVSKNCQYEYINFYSLHYCILKGSFILTSIITLLLLFILFFILCSTRDIFLSSSISKVIEIFKIKQNIAEVTLIPFLNSAPDIISSWAATKRPEGIIFSISSLIGNGLFTTSIFIGLVVLKAKEILVNSKKLHRYLILYLISLCLIIFIGLKKNIKIYDSLTFILIYILIVFIAFLNNKKNNNNNKEKKLLDYKIMDKGKKIHENKNIKDIKIIDDIKSNYTKIELEQKINSNIGLYQNDVYNNEDIFNEIKEDIKKEQEILINYNENPVSEIINENRNYLDYKEIYFQKENLYNKEKEWGEISPFWKAFYILIYLPLLFIRELTMPVLENKKWSKIKFCFMPFCDLIIISFAFKCK